MRHVRPAAALAVALLLAAVHAAAPDAPSRQAWLEGLALPLGYGHLIAGALSSRRRSRRGGGAAAAAAWLGAFTAFAAYTRALQLPALREWLLPALLLVSAWHIVENDRAISRLGPGDLDLAPPRASPRELAAAAAALLALALAALSTGDGRHWSFLATGRALPVATGLSLADLAAAVLLYHAASFVGFGLERARRLGGARGRRLRRLLVLSHALPLAGNALLAGWLDAVHALVAAPAFYLFWSVLHAFATARRRLSRRGAVLG